MKGWDLKYRFKNSISSHNLIWFVQLFLVSGTHSILAESVVLEFGDHTNIWSQDRMEYLRVLWF